MLIAKICSVLFLLTIALFLIYTFGKRYSVHLEIQRKLLHIALGLIALSFPFLFNSALDVALLMIASLSVLLFLYYIPILRRTLGESIFGVQRSWIGGASFALGIAVLFWAAKGNYVLYAGPIMVLTVGDAFAAIIGTKYGTKHYTIFGGNKSLEGSAAFFIMAFVGVMILVSLYTDHSLIATVYISIIVGIFSTVAELVSGRNFDNLTVPSITFFLLKYLV